MRFFKLREHRNATDRIFYVARSGTLLERPHRGALSGGDSMNGIAKAALTLVIIGALNWLLVGAFGFDLVAALFGSMTVLARIVYGLVGLAGLYCVSLLFLPSTTVSRVDSFRRAA
jgi:hypothetical protein